VIKVIIFDWGNVVTYYHVEDCMKKLAQHFNVEYDFLRRVELENRLLHDLGEISPEEFVANISARIQKEISVEEYYGLLERFGLEEPNVELMELIKHLRMTYKVFLLSNNSQPVFDALQNSEVKTLFDKILFSFQVNVKKPDRVFFELLLEGTTYTFDDCLLIDDRADVCTIAEGYGIESITFKNNEQLKSDLRSREVI